MMLDLRNVFPLLLLFVTGCAPLAEGDAGDDEPQATEDTQYPAPNTNLVARVGRDDAVDIATWNIENFPHRSTTPAVVADLIASLDLDVIAVQEIRDVAAFEELVARLPGFRSVLSAHTYSDGTYQKVGYLYRSDVVTLSDAVSLFQGSGYEFPRPPLQVSLHVTGTDVSFTLITLHLKAGFAADDIERRRGAAALLAGHVRGMIDGPADDEVVVLGDLNDTVTHPSGQEVFAPFLDDPELRWQTEALAMQGETSYLPSQSLIDHIVTTSALDEELSGSGGARIPRLDVQLGSYQDEVSDHLPVVLSFPVLP